MEELRATAKPNSNGTATIKPKCFSCGNDPFEETKK
jgi:hypothetical protein